MTLGICFCRLLQHRDGDFLLRVTSFNLIWVIIFNFYQILELVILTKRKPYILIIELIPRDCWQECIILICDLFRAVEGTRVVAGLLLVHRHYILVAIGCFPSASLVLQELSIFLQVHTLCTIFFFLSSPLVLLQPVLVLSSTTEASGVFVV